MNILSNNPFYHLLQEDCPLEDSLLDQYNEMFFINLIENKQERDLKAQLLASKLEQGQKQSPSCLQTLVNFVWAANLAYYAFETDSELEVYYWETMQDLNDTLMELLNDDFYKVKWLQGIARTYQLIDHLLIAVHTYQKAIAYEEEKFANSAQQPITQSLHDLLVEFAELRLKQAKLSQKKPEPELAKQYFEIAQQTASRALTYTQSQDKAKLYYLITQTNYYLAKEKRASDKQAAIKGFFSAINAAVAGYKSSRINKPAYLQAIQMCHKMLSPLVKVLTNEEHNPISKPLAQSSKYTLRAIHVLDELIDKIKQENSASLDLTNDLEQCSKQIRKYISWTKGNPASFWKADILVGQSINNNAVPISKVRNEM